MSCLLIGMLEMVRDAASGSSKIPSRNLKNTEFFAEIEIFKFHNGILLVPEVFFVAHCIANLVKLY